MAFFIGIACPWILVGILDRIAERRRESELENLGLTQAPPPAASAYLTPDRPY